MLPKLAVSAKLFICLLMVTMTGAGPRPGFSVSRPALFFNEGASAYVSMDRSGRILANSTTRDKWTSFTVQSIDRQRIRIYANEARRYICLTRKWKPVGMKNFKPSRCEFIEEETAQAQMRYKSAGNHGFYLGFNKQGSPLRGLERIKKVLIGKPPLLNFLKLTSTTSDIQKHNEVMRGQSHQYVIHSNPSLFGDRLSFDTEVRIRHRNHHRSRHP